MKEGIGGIKHPAFRDALALTRAGGRATAGRYLVEDLDLVRQALCSPAVLRAVFASPEAAAHLEADCAARSTPLYVLGNGLITKLVGTSYETAVSAVAVVSQSVTPPEKLLTLTPDALVLAGEKIQDPRNVGVLVRTADAAGCAALLLSNDSAEPFSRQAVRSTTGSILRLPVSLASDFSAALLALKARGARIVVSSGRADTLAFDADLRARPLVLVVGNEQTGVSPDVEAAADAFVKLPMAAGSEADSLNVTVAGGALVYEAIRQRLANRVH